MQIVVQPGSLADRNYFSWQKIFGKNHALLEEIEIIWQNLQAFVSKSQLLHLTQRRCPVISVAHPIKF